VPTLKPACPRSTWIHTCTTLPGQWPGPFNWKTLIDKYNEYYHCSVAHPSIAATTDLPNYAVETEGSFFAHFARLKPEIAIANDSNVAPKFVFPSSSATINIVYMYLMRVVPTGPAPVNMQYEIFRHSSCNDEEFAEMDEFLKQIENEDRVLCTNVQRNLKAGVYEAGPLNPETEKGVRYFQRLVKETLTSHQEEERKTCQEIDKRYKDGSRGEVLRGSLC
jgi:phenylpropionate dioxygenase-like ring-hydroxylating dioxygenase large terminal subunit